ncbi:MAG: hypothetical protein ACYC7A_03680 [Thermoanaerobaculia bacterium]
MSFLQTVVSHNGPLPIQTTFYAKGDGGVALFISGTVIAGGPSRVGVRLTIDGIDVATTTRHASVAGHSTLVPMLVQTSVTYGQHSIEVKPVGETTADEDDFFFVTIVY